jgi:beta-mannosidase
VGLERRRVVALEDGDVLPTLGSAGPALVADLRVRPLDGARVAVATIDCAGTRHPLAVHALADGCVRVTGTVPVPDAARWWPHTHGAPALHALALDLETSAGPVRVEFGDVGFRTVAVHRAGGAFELRVNGVPVFCRGACWTPLDAVSLRADDGELDRTLGRVRDAGMNMLRVLGVGAYEDARFHARCDALGVLVWQDFMFARMDYPDEPAWTAEALAEVGEVVAARRRHASLAVWCGNSEVSQQAAMLGLAPEAWRPAFFRDAVPRAVRAAGSDAVFVEGSPCGAPLPFSPSSGVAHYFGVGAYRRPLSELRRTGVRFAAESLALANVPRDEALAELADATDVAPLDARWKRRVPRDPGASWDFDDVRDHYLGLLFGVDPVTLRSRDAARYLELSRVVSGEVMARALAEWRRDGSPCAGALVLLLRDAWAGAGWGVLDHHGEPKAAWHLLRRACAPRAVFLLDEGLDGLWAHVVNDAPEPLEGRLRLAVLRHGALQVDAGDCAVRVPPHATRAIPCTDVLGRFADLTQAYRFGPPGHDAVTCLLEDDGAVRATDVYFPGGLPRATTDVGLAGRVVETGDDARTLELVARRLAYAVHVRAEGWEALEDYVHVVPGVGTRVRLRRRDAAPAGTVAQARALNGIAAARIDLDAR